MKAYLDLFRITFKEWNEDKVPRLASSLAYYTAFSLAPLLLVMIAIVGFFFGDEAARGQVVGTLSHELGPDIAEFIQELIQSADDEEQGIISTVISSVMLVVGATGVFMQLQTALNEVWDIEVEGGLMVMLKKRLLSFGIIMTLAFLLLISLVITSVITSLDSFLVGILPGVQFLIQAVVWLISLGISTLLFAIIYKYMPDATIKWRDVMIGSLFTAILFNIGRLLLGLYIGNVGVASSYGAAGSFVVILLWVYYSTQIMMFGAEFTQVYARQFGTRIVPEEGASFTPDRPSAEEMREQEEPKEKKDKVADEQVLISPLPEDVDKHPVPEPKSNSTFALIVSSLTAVVGGIIGWIIGNAKGEKR